MAQSAARSHRKSRRTRSQTRTRKRRHAKRGEGLKIPLAGPIRTDSMDDLKNDPAVSDASNAESATTAVQPRPWSRLVCGWIQLGRRCSTGRDRHTNLQEEFLLAGWRTDAKHPDWPGR